MFEQVGKIIDDERVGIGGRVVEGLNHGAAADGAGVAVEEFFEVVVGADEDAAVFVGAALAADGDFGARSGLAGVARWVGVEALEKLGGGAEEALTFFGERLELRVGKRRGAEDIDRDHRVDDGLVAGVVDFQHDVGAESLDRIEEDGAGVEAEVALALVEDDVVLLQIHGATGEDTRVRGDGEGRGVVAELDFIEEAATGEAGDDVFKIETGEFRRERVADLMRREEDAAARVDRDGVGEFEVVGLDGGPDFRGGEFGGGRRVKKTTDRSAGAEEFFPVGGVGETRVVDEGVGGEDEAVALDHGRALEEHLDADAGERAALGEFQLG